VPPAVASLLRITGSGAFDVSSNIDPTIINRDEGEQKQIRHWFTLFYTKTSLKVAHLFYTTTNDALS
jgi:hypothetical protein